MSIGSAFDSRAKAYLVSKLKGKVELEEEAFEFQFNASVEMQNRDWARRESLSLLNTYKQMGVLDHLLRELEKSPIEPRFEFELTGDVRVKDKTVVYKGKPDVFYCSPDGIAVMFDFKVKGYCSEHNVSPMKGFFRGWGTTKPIHPDCYKEKLGENTFYNHTYALEDIQKDWASQLSIYAWLCGAAVGSKCLMVIHEILGNPLVKPIRVAESRCLVGADYQHQTFNDSYTLWDSVQRDHFFSDLSLADSQARCNMLDAMAANPNKEPLDEPAKKKFW